MDTGITVIQQRNLWCITTAHTSYVIGSADGLLLNVYWGARLSSAEDVPNAQLSTAASSHDTSLSNSPEEYPTYSGMRYGEIALAAILSDGSRHIECRNTAYTIDDSDSQRPVLLLFMEDSIAQLQITLRYQADIANDVIARSVIIKNIGTTPITLTRMFSAAWNLPRMMEPVKMTTLAGAWGREVQQYVTTLAPQTVTLESRSGITGFTHAPYMLLECETSPNVWAFSLGWSGSWIMRVTQSIFNLITVTGGVHDFDSEWTLQNDQEWVTPQFFGVYATSQSKASQLLASHAREHILPETHKHTAVPILFNSWETAAFQVNEQQQMQLAETAADLGAELFVMDDGWFCGRNSDHAGLGDWTADPVKFPNGVRLLAQRAHELGMQFGIWVEPEMVNPDSDLYRAHPEWVYHYAGRRRSESRNQLVLNMCRNDVKEYIYAQLVALIGQNTVDYMKWDMNRPISEPGWPEHPELGKEIWIRHTLAVYEIMDRLRIVFPQLRIESCASGGGRIDYEILRRADQVWLSDNTDADDRLTMFEGYMRYLPGRVMQNWVTDAPNFLTRSQIPMRFRAHAAMLGNMAIGAAIDRLSETDYFELQSAVEFYKNTVRNIAQNGNFTLLCSWKSGISAIQCAYKKEIALFLFRKHTAYGTSIPPIRLCDLAENKLYAVKQSGAAEYIRSGSYLMHIGVEQALPKRGPYQSDIIIIKQID